MSATYGSITRALPSSPVSVTSPWSETKSPPPVSVTSHSSETKSLAERNRVLQVGCPQTKKKFQLDLKEYNLCGRGSPVVSPSELPKKEDREEWYAKLAKTASALKDPKTFSSNFDQFQVKEHALYLSMFKRYPNAAEVYGILSKKCPKNPYYLHCYARMLAKVNDHENAIAEYRKLLKIDPLHIQGIADLIVLLRHFEGDKEALEVAEPYVGREIKPREEILKIKAVGYNDR